MPPCPPPPLPPPQPFLHPYICLPSSIFLISFPLFLSSSLPTSLALLVFAPSSSVPPLFCSCSSHILYPCALRNLCPRRGPYFPLPSRRFFNQTPSHSQPTAPSSFPLVPLRPPPHRSRRIVSLFGFHPLPYTLDPNNLHSSNPLPTEVNAVAARSGRRGGRRDEKQKKKWNKKNYKKNSEKSEENTKTTLSVLGALRRTPFRMLHECRRSAVVTCMLWFFDKSNSGNPLLCIFFLHFYRMIRWLLKWRSWLYVYFFGVLVKCRGNFYPAKTFINYLKKTVVEFELVCVHGLFN